MGRFFPLKFHSVLVCTNRYSVHVEGQALDSDFPAISLNGNLPFSEDFRVIHLLVIRDQPLAGRKTYMEAIPGL